MTIGWRCQFLASCKKDECSLPHGPLHTAAWESSKHDIWPTPELEIQESKAKSPCFFSFSYRSCTPLFPHSSESHYLHSLYYSVCMCKTLHEYQEVGIIWIILVVGHNTFPQAFKHIQFSPNLNKQQKTTQSYPTKSLCNVQILILTFFSCFSSLYLKLLKNSCLHFLLLFLHLNSLLILSFTSQCLAG